MQKNSFRPLRAQKIPSEGPLIEQVTPLVLEGCGIDGHRQVQKEKWEGAKFLEEWRVHGIENDLVRPEVRISSRNVNDLVDRDRLLSKQYERHRQCRNQQTSARDPPR